MAANSMREIEKGIEAMARRMIDEAMRAFGEHAVDVRVDAYMAGVKAARAKAVEVIRAAYDEAALGDASADAVIALDRVRDAVDRMGVGYDYGLDLGKAPVDRRSPMMADLMVAASEVAQHKAALIAAEVQHDGSLRNVALDHYLMARDRLAEVAVGMYLAPVVAPYVSVSEVTEKPMPHLLIGTREYDEVIANWGKAEVTTGGAIRAGIDIDADDLIDTLVEIRPGPGSGFGSIVRSPQHVHVVSRVIGGIQVARKRSADFYRDRSGKVGEEG